MKSLHFSFTVHNNLTCPYLFYKWIYRFRQVKFLWTVNEKRKDYTGTEGEYCFESNEKKLSFCNENIQHCCLKKIRCNIIRKLKFNSANNCIPICPSVLILLGMNLILWKELKYCALKIGKSCDATIIYIKSWAYYAYTAMVRYCLFRAEKTIVYLPVC